MKTNLLYWVLFFLASGNLSFSQEYHPFLNNSSWIINDWVSCCRQPYVRTINEGTDTIIGNYTYKKFSDPFPQSDWILNPGTVTWETLDTVYIREDIAARKVYHIVHGNDQMLYDFSLEIGNTFSQYGFDWIVSDIDEIEVNGGNRKRMTLSITQPHNGHILTMKWIEGVGSNSHPFYPQHNMYNVESSSGGYNIVTKCSFQDGVHIYGSDDYCETALRRTDNLLAEQNITFSPNPFVSELTISSDRILENAALKLYNIQGQLVREVDHLKGNLISIRREHLSNGLYFARLSENGALIKSGKIIVN